VLYFPSHLYAPMRGLPFPGPRAILGDPLQIAVYLPPLIWLAAAFIFSCHYRSNSPTVTPAAHPWSMLLLGALSAFFFLKGLVRVSVIHMALSILPAMMLAATLLPYAKRSTGQIGWPKMIAFYALLIVVTVPTMISVKRDGAAVTRNIVWSTRPSTWLGAANDQKGSWASCVRSPGLGPIACFGTDQARADASEYVRAHTKREDAIFVGLSQHDRIVVNDMLFYFVAERRPATKWYHFDPGLQTSLEIQEKIVRELQAVKPPYVILEADLNGFDEPNGSSVRSGITVLDEFIGANYRPVETFDTITILEAKERGA